MDLSNPWVLLSGLFLGAVGMALCIYGKKQADLRVLTAGVALCAAPYFITSLLILWLVSAALLAALFAWIRHA